MQTDCNFVCLFAQSSRVLLSQSQVANCSYWTDRSCNQLSYWYTCLPFCVINRLLCWDQAVKTSFSLSVLDLKVCLLQFSVLTQGELRSLFPQVLRLHGGSLCHAPC